MSWLCCSCIRCSRKFDEESESLRVLRFVKGNGLNLQHEPRFRIDRSIVLEAVTQNGLALEYASRALRADRDVVLQAAKQNGYALEYAADVLRSDREVVLQAIRQNPHSLEWASIVLLGDREVIREAVLIDATAVRFAFFRGAFAPPRR